MTTMTLTPTGRPALLVTRSADLAATVHALAPPDQPLLVITPDQLPDTGWARCPLILIDADTAPETTALMGASLDARKPVLLSARLDTTAQLWRAAVALRVEHVACLPEATDWVRDRLRAATHDNTLVITVLDVCGDPHGTALAAALAAASCAAGRDTLLAATSDHLDTVAAHLDALPATPRPLVTGTCCCSAATPTRPESRLRTCSGTATETPAHPESPLRRSTACLPTLSRATP